MLASHMGQDHVVTRLLDLGADLHHTDRDHNTALLLAIQSGHLGIVSLLLSRGATMEHANKVRANIIHAFFSSNKR
jgi:ankyrin repeat protein